MLRVTHKVIAERIAAELQLPKSATQLLIEGSVGPDSHANFPHATGKNGIILQKIGKARTFFLENYDECYGELGNALHYIQDKWVSEQTKDEESVVFLDDEIFQRSVAKLSTAKQAMKDYLRIANSLLAVKKKGLDSWFNHSWGFWHRDYASCVFVFTDILELMLPTLKPNFSVTTKKEDVELFVKSDDFKKCAGDAFAVSIRNNFLKPKLAGYPAAVYSLAMTEPPADNRDSTMDLNIAYRLSLEIARHNLLQPEQFKSIDDWTIRKKIGEKPINLAWILPQYHVLIPKPVEVVQAERNMIFEEERKAFLRDWPYYEKSLSGLKYHSDVWKILLTGLAELLKRDANKT